MVAVYRAPMRSRDDDIDWAATLERAFTLGLVGFGDVDTTDRRVQRFADVDVGSFVWTRDAAGWYRLGRIDGPYSHDGSAEALAVDLVHVRPCRWSARPIPEHRVPTAVLATFARGGRNFQRTHDPAVGDESETVWRRSPQV